MQQIVIEGAKGTLQLPDSFVLVVAGAPTTVSTVFLTTLAGMADSIIAADSGADCLARANLVVDHLVGDMDSISEEGREFALASGAMHTQVPAEKDYTDTYLALEVARAYGAKNVVMTAATGGRLDQCLGVLGALVEAKDLSPLVLDEHEIVCLLDAASPRTKVYLRDLGLAPGDEFSVFSLIPGTVLTEQGVKYPLEHHELAVLDTLGISNVMMTADAEVVCEQGTALVIISG